MGFIIRGFIWDIPILIFAYVLFWGPNINIPCILNLELRTQGQADLGLPKSYSTQRVHIFFIKDLGPQSHNKDGLLGTIIPQEKCIWALWGRPQKVVKPDKGQLVLLGVQPFWLLL